MGRTIDENVAVLRFDNKSFEANVQTSLGTLEKLKQALRFDKYAKTFAEIEVASKNISFSKLAESIYKIQNRFSTLGIVGMTVIQDLTRSIEGLVTGAMRAAERAVSFIGTKIYEGGKRRALNIEQARFLLNGLISDGAEVERIMKIAQESVNETAYGLDEAALAASNLVASGVEAGESLEKALAGIAGLAATTSTDYDGIARIFSQISSYGKVMSNDYLQLSTRGVNATAVIADYFNKVNEGSVEASESVKNLIAQLTNGAKVTEGDIQDLTRKGVITFELFSAAMSEKFGAHAKDANKTLTGVLSNVNARFSQIGAKFIQPLVEQEGPLVQFFNKVKDKLAEIRDQLDPLANLFDKTIIKGLDIVSSYIDKIDVDKIFGKVNPFLDKINSFLFPSVGKDMIKGLGLSEESLKSFKKTLKEVAKDHGIDIDGMRKNEESFWDTLDKGWLTADLLTEAIGKLTGAEAENAEQTGTTVDKLKELANLVIKGDFGNGAERFAKLSEIVEDPQKVQDLVNKIHELAGGTWNYDEATIQAAADALGLGDVMSKVSKFSEEDKKALEELVNAAESMKSPFDRLTELVDGLHGKFMSFLEIVKNIASNVKKLGGAVKDGFGDVFGEMIPDFNTIRTTFGNGLGIISGFLKTFTIDEKRLDQVKRIFRGIFSVAKIVLEFVTAIFGKILPSFFEDGKTGAESLIEFIAVIADKIYEFSKNFEISEDTINKVTGTIKGVLSIVGIVFNAISRFLKSAYGPFSKAISFIYNTVPGFIVDKMALLGNALTNISETFRKVDGFQNGVKTILDFFKNLEIPKKFMDFIKGLKLPKGVTDFFEKLQSVSDTSKKIDASTISKKLSTIADAIKDFVDDFLTIDFVVPIAALFLLYKLINGISKLFKSAKSVPDAVTDFLNKIAALPKSIGEMFDEFGKLAKKIGNAAMIFSIAYAFVSIANAVLMLSEIKPEGLKQAIVLTFLITGAIIGMYSAIAAISAKAKMNPSVEAIAFVVLSARAFVDMAKALKKLEKLSIGKIVGSLTAMSAALIIMSFVAAVLGKLETKLSLSALLVPIIYAKGLNEIAKALVKLKDLSGGQMMTGAIVLLGTLGVLLLIAERLNKLEYRVNLSDLVFPILYARGLVNIAKALVMLKDLNDVQILNGMFGLLASLSIMAVIAYKLSKLETKLDLSALVFPILYAEGLSIIAKALAKLKDMSDTDILNAMFALLGSLAAMAYIAYRISKLKNKLNLGDLVFPILYAEGLKGIAKALTKLKDMTDVQILSGMFALLVILAVMAVIAAELSKLKTELSMSALLFPILYAEGLKGIAKAFTKLKDMDDVQILNGMFALLGSLAVMAFIAKKLNDLKTELNLSALAFPIVYAAGLRSIAKSLTMLKDLTDVQILNGMMALLGSLAIMALIAQKLSKLQTEIKPSALLFPIVYALALKEIARALYKLKDLTDVQILDAMFALLGSLAIMALIGVKLSQVESQLDVSLLAMPIAFAAGLLILAAAIRIVGTMAQDDLIQGLLAMVGAMVIFGGLIALMTALEAPLNKIADTLLKFAGAALFVSIGFAIISGAFILLGIAIKMFQEVNIDQVMTALTALGGAMLIFGLAASAVGLLGVKLIFLGTGFLILSLAIYVLIEALINLNENFDKIAEGASQLGPVLLNVLGGMLTGLVNLIMSHIPQFVLGGALLIAGLVSGVALGPALLIAVLGILIFQARGFILSHIGDFAQAGVNLILGFMTGLASMFTPVLEAIDGFVGGIVSKVCSVLGIESPSKVFEWIGQMMDEGMKNGVEGNASTVTDSVTNMASDAKNSFMEEFLKNNELMNTGAEGASQAVEGFTSGFPDMENASTEMLDLTNFNMEDYINGGAFELNGEKIDLTTIDGLNNKASEVSDAAVTVTQDACNDVGNTVGDWKSVGHSLGDGLADGIRDSGSYVSSVARQIVENANAAAAAAAQVNSPSKVWMRLGNYLDEGLIKGMLAMGSEVNRTSESVMNGVIDAAKSPIDQLADLMSGDIIDDPTITPVLDLSEIQNGANRLYSMLPDSERLSLNGNVDLASMTSRSVDLDRRRKADSDNQMMGSLIDAINGLSALIGNTGNTYNVNGVTYDDGSNISSAVRTLVRAAVVEGRA